jgi:hypothetical protein
LFFKRMKERSSIRTLSEGSRKGAIDTGLIADEPAVCFTVRPFDVNEIRFDLQSVLEGRNGPQANQKLVSDSRKALVPGMYFVCPTDRLQRVAGQAVSRIN